MLFAANFRSEGNSNLFSKISFPSVKDTIPRRDTIPDDTTKLRYPFRDNDGNPYNSQSSSPLYLKQPSNVNQQIEYDPKTGEFIIRNRVGNIDNRTPHRMSFDEYRGFDYQNSVRDYWNERRRLENSSNSGSLGVLEKYLNPKLNVGIEGFDKIFGTNTIQIKPQGAVEVTFGVDISTIENPILPVNLQRNVNFDFDMKVQLGVTGQIGNKLKIGITYNTEATFDFENQTKLAYTGDDDDIIKLIEAGNVSLPLTGTLITGSSSLFGVKTQLQFGKLTVTSVLSQQKGQTQNIEIQGGAQANNFEVPVDQYEANKHFFLSHYFKENYDKALQNLPIIQSGITITRVEVWITNRSGKPDEARDIVAFMDLGENNANIYAKQLIHQVRVGEFLPRDSINNLYEMMTSSYQNIRDINKVTTTLLPLSSQRFLAGQDYEKVEKARKLSQNEYTFNAKLGFISLNGALNADEVLAVAYEYTVGGRTYRVGEFSNGGIAAPQSLIVKLLKGTNLTPKLPTWQLMMKNVYALGAYQVNNDEFVLNVLYQSDKTGTSINYIPEGDINGKVLLQVLNLDRLNSQNASSPDGRFDFIEGITIQAANGRIIFPMLEPFGKYLRNKIGNNDIADKYVYQELYDSTRSVAKQVAEKNKFLLKGTYRSSVGSEINLNAMNIPQGSVVVTSGGRKLEEGTDYIVDYTIGRLTMLNQSLLESGAPIKISLENNALFSIGTKTLLGTHLDYSVSKDFSLGATILHLSEKPLTSKVNIGDEPIANTIWGLDGTYTREVPLLTRLVDKLPFIATKEKSTLTISGEFAQLIPGHSDALEESSGVSYIDDFEGSKREIDIKSPINWFLASVPQGQNRLFPEAYFTNDLRYGFNRAKIAWYNINSDFLRNTAGTPSYLSKDDQSDHFVREIFEKEIFPNRESPNGVPVALQVLNLAYYPDERGPYNFDAGGKSGISAGVDSEGRLNLPQTRWAGIMRKLVTNDFEAANIEFIEFWLMDPFIKDSSQNGGDLYFNLGNISEDVLKDSRKSFENGLPTTNEVKLVDTTAWGRVPMVQAVVNAFDNNPESRKFQDVGYDGLSTSDENSFFQKYIDTLRQMFGEQSVAYQLALRDPSNDNYHFYNGGDYDEEKLSILDRYKRFNDVDGNSPTGNQTNATQMPDIEDINQDNTLSENESYFQYRVSLRPEDMKVGKNHITNIMTSTVLLKNKRTATVKWYQFKIPIQQPDAIIGAIQDFKSIRFARMFLKGFDKLIVLRFAKLDLVSGDWRKYTSNISQGSEGTTYPQLESGEFDVGAVNIEENGKKTPVNYVLPPGISRVIDPTNTQMRQLNEQAMVLKVIDLEDGDAKAVFKNVGMDVRQYRKLQMEVHAEGLNGENLKDNELCMFIRLGTDAKQNYYEYEIPLKLTPAGYYEDVDEDKIIVWPTENRLNIDFEILQRVKQERNNDMRKANSNVTLATVYSILDGKNRVSVIGNPNLSNIRTIMIGVRNPSQSTNRTEDDGSSKSGEIWVNELRLTDFKEDGGWAATGRTTFKLADFSTITVSGMTSKPGFGSIEKKVNERSKEDVYQYDISSTFELGKFFPQKYGVKIPMYIGYSESFSNPQYNPLDPDIPLSTTLNNPEISNKEKDSIIRICQDYVRRKSINFTNMNIAGKPSKAGEPPKFYSISNWTATYSFNEVYTRNINTEFNRTRQHLGMIHYNFNNRPNNVMPFKKVNFPKALQIIKDFNVYYAPTQVSVGTQLTKFYNETKMRNLDNPDIIITPSYKKDFMWIRTYDVKYNLTKGLKIDFNAQNTSRIEEPDGRVESDMPDYDRKMDTVWRNLLRLGHTTEYTHTLNVNYTVPIKKLPLLEWTNMTARYKATYDWQGTPEIAGDSIELGNIVKNSRSFQIGLQLDFQELYNNIDYLKQLNQKNKRGKGAANKPQKKMKEVTFEQQVDLKANVPKTITHNLGSQEVQINVVDEKGEEVRGELQIVNENKVKFTTKEDHINAVATVTGKIEDKETPLKIILDGIINVVTCLKNISITYTQNDGTLLPGYLPQTRILGQQNYNGVYAPGLGFAFGEQDRDFTKKAAENGWITLDSMVNSPYIMTPGYDLDIKITLEPIKGLKIDISGDKSYKENISEFWVADNNGNFKPRNRMITGNFSISYNTFLTSFAAVGSDYSSTTYNKFKENRQTIALRLANERVSKGKKPYNPNEVNINPRDAAYPKGYGSLYQEVLIPSFLAAYADKNANDIELTNFPTIPLPNWRIVYDGLSDLEIVKKYAKSVNITHSYLSSYSVGNFATNPNFNFDEIEEFGFTYQTDAANGWFLPNNEIATVTLDEKFAPLAGLDIAWGAANLTSKIEYRKSRNITLTFSNNQVNETYSNEWVVGLGYRFNEVPMILRVGGTQKKFKSELTLRGDVSYRDMMTIVRKIEEETDQLTAGQSNTSIKLSADYLINEQFTVKLFYDHSINTPKISTSFPTSNIKFGITVRFTLIP